MLASKHPPALHVVFKQDALSLISLQRLFGSFAVAFDHSIHHLQKITPFLINKMSEKWIIFNRG